MCVWGGGGGGVYILHRYQSVNDLLHLFYGGWTERITALWHSLSHYQDADLLQNRNVCYFQQRLALSVLFGPEVTLCGGQDINIQALSVLLSQVNTIGCRLISGSEHCSAQDQN